MDFRRTLLYATFALLLVILYQRWTEFSAARYAETAPVSSSESAPAINTPAGNSTDLAPNLPAASTPAPASSSEPTDGGDVVTIETPLVSIEMSTAGAHISVLRLKEYPLDVDHRDTPFTLIGVNAAAFLTEFSGFTSSPAGLVPDHRALYTSESSSYTLAAGETAEVVFSHTDNTGRVFRKVYAFSGDSYEIDVRFEVDNTAAEPLTLSYYTLLERNSGSPKTGGTFFASPRSYYGAAYYNEEDKYNKVDYDDLANGELNSSTSDGWIAMLQHYFLTAWLPGQNEPIRIYGQPGSGNDRYRIGYIYERPQAVAAGASASFETRLYAGPKLKDTLDAQPASRLALAIDFGWLTIIADPLLWLLQAIHTFVQNWGWSIIGLTILIKLLFFPLTAASFRSTAKMKKLQPRLATLKERYGDDRQRFQQEMMKLYQQEKINPLGGCLPILIQIPVFIALYWVLLESVELRQADFFWLKDLSIPDPLFILPALYFVTMFAMQKLNPAPLDPMQQKIMTFLPVVFSIFMIWFPSGLVLYWVVNNTLSIAQQWYITRKINAAK